MQSSAKTVPAYLKSLPAERRAVVAAVRRVIRANLARGFKETMGWGQIAYGIPLRRYPDTYNGQPLCYAGLAAQKHNYALYLMCVYGDPKRGAQLTKAFKAAGKRLDRGKSCIRFKKLEDLPLGAIGKLVGSMSVDDYIARYERSRKR